MYFTLRYFKVLFKYYSVLILYACFVKHIIVLSIFQIIIFLSISWGTIADPKPREKDDEPVLEIQFYEVFYMFLKVKSRNINLFI